MTKQISLPLRGYQNETTAQEFYEHSTAARICTDTVIARSLQKRYPELHLTIVPEWDANLLAYAGAGHAKATPIEDDEDKEFATLEWHRYVPPAKRIGGGQGYVAVSLKFGKFEYKWNGHDYIIYLVDGRDGTMPYSVQNYYILSTQKWMAEALITKVGFHASQPRDQIWVYDGGYWQLSSELYHTVMKSSWDDVILDDDMKASIIEDISSFFNSEETYKKLKVSWKRGLIFHGPPGNGKTISIKAIIHSLYKRKEPIPTLYVRSLASFGGPEYSLATIFGKARQVAPCFLVFEDLDSVVSDDVRSYFLNEIDGLRSNDGILIIGSTNHLDRLDPGIAKRPSRFDRKYYFPEPNYNERVTYCEFWRAKLSDNDDIEFPSKLCGAIADITKDFSFAYIQEAFVAALLSIAAGSTRAAERDFSSKDWQEPWKILFSMQDVPASVGDSDEDLKHLILWKAIKKQVKILRDQIDQEKESWARGLLKSSPLALAASNNTTSNLPPQSTFKNPSG